MPMPSWKVPDFTVTKMPKSFGKEKTMGIRITKALADHLVAEHHAPPTAANASDETRSNVYSPIVARLLVSDELSTEMYEKLSMEGTKMSKTITPEKMFVRQRRAGEGYCEEKQVGIHSRTKEPVLDELGQPALLPSQLENAKAGAMLKRLAQKAGLQVELSDHEQDLLAACFDDPWCGEIGGQHEKVFDGMRAKALLDDSTSGGLEAVPIWFDENLVQFALLHGELLPFVDSVAVPRGRRVEGASVANAAIVWGVAEGTAMTAFDTADLVAALDTTIFPATCAIEVGRDALADSPAALGAILTANIGQGLLAEFDEMIAVGNGTTQPDGICAASGITTSAKSGGNGSAWVINDLETLSFAVNKAYRKSIFNPCFVGNDTTYARLRGINVGAADARRIFGLDQQSYTLLGWPYKVQNDIPNATLLFSCLQKYRWYKREGVSVEWSTAGRTLMLANKSLLVVRSRVGGRVMDGNGTAQITTGQA
jgi:HK97 family phage major capsid protein